MSDYAIETHGLRKSFGDLHAVDGIDLAVPRGSFYGFLGPNGAGKSTTIKCLTGLLRPSAGSFRILGLDPVLDAVAIRRRIGVVPEDLAVRAPDRGGDPGLRGPGARAGAGGARRAGGGAAGLPRPGGGGRRAGGRLLA